MFDLFKETDTEEKCLLFLQKNKCLPSEKDCPSCGEKMVLSERSDRALLHVFRCQRRHGDKMPRCAQKMSLTKCNISMACT